MTFLIEQMEVAFMQNMHQRYSPDLLSTCVLWENTSCNLCKKIQEEGLLIISSQQYINKLISALCLHWLNLDAWAAKLIEREKIGSLLRNEVYVAKVIAILSFNLLEASNTFNKP